MQGLILAAGMGKRLGKYTQDGTKCMVPVNGKTLIEHALEALAGAGVQRVVLVVGYRAEKLKSFLDGRYPHLELVYVTNEIYDKTNNIYSLWMARDYLAAEDTLLLESDLIFEASMIQELVDDPHPNLAVVSKFESWMDGTVTLVDQDRTILSIIDKAHFQWSHIEEYYKTVNIYKFSKEFSTRFYLPFLDAYMKAFGTNDYYEQALKVLAMLEVSQLKALKVSGRRWYEIDDPHDLSIAETLFTDTSSALDQMHARYGGYWRFPGMLDYCYLVNPYFPPARLVKEMQSSFVDLATQYPSGARVQSLLAGKVFSVDPERITVGNGAAELIDLVARFLPGTIVLPEPAFLEYPARFGKDRTTYLPSGTQGFRYSGAELREGLKKADILILVNPDNPSGHFLGEAEVKALVEDCGRQGKKLIVDESFVDFATPDQKFTLLDDAFLAAHPHLTVIKSISKSYGVPGFRLGVLASGDVDLVSKVRKAAPVWNVNSFGEFFLQIVDKYKSDYRTSCEKIAGERVRFSAQLATLPGVHVYPSQANYLLIRVDGGPTSRQIAEGLLSNHRILVKEFTARAGFPTGEFLRLAIRTQPENERLAQCLGEVLRPRT